MTVGDVAPWVAAVVMAAFALYERLIGRGIWRNVAEGRGEMIDDLQDQLAAQDQRIAALEAKVGVMTTDFAKVIAEHVVREIEGAS